MRLKNSIINTISILILQIFGFGYGLIIKKMLLTSFPVSLVGVSSLFESIFNSLGLLDVGFSALLVYELYKPINENNQEEALRKLSIYKTIYLYISVILLIITFVMIPFLYSIFKIEYKNELFVKLIFIIQAIYTISRYWFIHKNAVINVYQKDYLSNVFLVIMEFISFIMKLISIVLLKNYLLYVIVVGLQVVSYYLVNYILVYKMYPMYHKVKCVSFRTIVNDGVFDKCKKYLYKSVYDFSNNTTDNLVLAAFYSTSIVAYHANYNSLLAILNNLIYSIFNALRSSFANLMHTSDDEDYLFCKFEQVNILNFILMSIVVSGLLIMFNDFISLWLGTEFVINNSTVTLMISILAIDGLCRPIENIFIIKGFMLKEKYPLIISGVSNVMISITTIPLFGVNAIYIGTFVSRIIFWTSKFIYVTKYVFVSNLSRIIKRQIEYIIKFILVILITCWFFAKFSIISSSIFMFALKAIIVVIVVLLINLVMNFNNKYLKEIIISIYKIIID